MINLCTAAVSLFENTSTQLRSNEDLEGLECSNYCYSCEFCISLMATLLEKKSAPPNKVKEHHIKSICGQQFFCFLRAYQHNSDQKKISKEQIYICNLLQTASNSWNLFKNIINCVIKICSFLRYHQEKPFQI